MAKLCPKGKAAAKRKFKVYPSAYANMYASKVCKGKVRASAKDGGSIKKTPDKKKNSKPSKKSGSSILDIFKSYKKYDGKPIELKNGGFVARGCGKIMLGRSKKTKVY